MTGRRSLPLLRWMHAVWTMVWFRLRFWCGKMSVEETIDVIHGRRMMFLQDDVEKECWW